MALWFWIASSSPILPAEVKLSPIAGCGFQGRAQGLFLVGMEEHPRGQADLKAFSYEAQPPRMVAGGVAKEVGIERREEGFASESGDTRSAGVSEAGGRINDKALIGGKPRLSEVITQARAEINVFPPCRFEGGVETAQSLPHGTPHQPRRSGRLWNGGRFFGR